MEPATAMLIAGGVGAAGNIVGGLMGNKAQKKALAQQKAMWDAQMAEYAALGYPPELARDIVLEEMKSVGTYTPELEQAIQQEESALAQISEDPALRQAQIQALSSLQERGQVGLSATDRAAANQLRSEVERDANARQQALMQKYQAQGMSGSGAELAAQLSAQQAATSERAAGADRLSSMAAQNALQAIAQGGNMAGSIRSQDLGVATTKAQAEDAMRQFNLQNAIARQQRNLASKNTAQATNLADQQKIADYNLQQRNAELQRKANLDIQDHQNKLNYLGSKYGTMQTGLDLVGKGGDLAANKYSAIGSAVGNLATTLGQNAPALSNMFNNWKSSSDTQAIGNVLNKPGYMQYSGQMGSGNIPSN